MRSLVDQKVISQSEFDQRRTQLEAARQNYQTEQNLADQSYRSLEGARARVALARKAVADTSVRAPLTGLVAERRGQRRRLRDARRSASPRSCGSIRCASSSRSPNSTCRSSRSGSRCGSPSTPIPGEEFAATVQVRLALAALGSARAHGRSDCAERRRPPQARLLRHRPRPSARRGPGAARARERGRNGRRHEPRLRREGQPDRRAHRHARREARRDRSRSRPASRRATSSPPNRRAVSRTASR